LRFLTNALAGLRHEYQVADHFGSWTQDAYDGVGTVVNAAQSKTPLPVTGTWVGSLTL
jgi:hypothetical protein